MATSVRLGLTRAAIRSAIAADLKESGVGRERDAIADAVADALDANNAEILRQLRDAFGLLQGAPPPNPVFPDAEE